MRHLSLIFALIVTPRAWAEAPYVVCSRVSNSIEDLWQFDLYVARDGVRTRTRLTP